MRFDVLTLFPESMDSFLNESIIGRAREKGLITINAINIRDFSTDKHRKTDDYPYGGGSGMVMTPQPIYDAWERVVRKSPKRPRTLYMSPQGRILTQKTAKRLRDEEHLIILCGHYEGVDERGLVEGVLSSEDSYSNESHYNGLLEYPQYTRPPEFMGRNVPDILISGHHAKIEKWRYLQMLERTKEKRPDMFAQYESENSEKVLDAYGLLPKRRRRKKAGSENVCEKGTPGLPDVPSDS